MGGTVTVLHQYALIAWTSTTFPFCYSLSSAILSFLFVIEPCFHRFLVCSSGDDLMNVLK